MRAVTLLYHDVVVNGNFGSSGFACGTAASYKLDLVDFEQHLAAISEAASGGPARVYDLEAMEIAGKRPQARWHTSCSGADPCFQPPARRARLPFLLTFDDGGMSAHTHIAELLENYGWVGHFFITVNEIGQPAFMTAEHIRDLQRRGHVVGSHSCSHPERMARLSWDQLVAEWGKSVESLSAILGVPVTVASVPNGYYSATVAQAASQVGITSLFTSEPTTRTEHVGACRVLGRYIVRRGVRAQVAAEIVAGSFAPRLRQSVFWNLKKVPKVLLGDSYAQMSRRYYQKWLDSYLT